jgi:ribosomal protein L11 methyltransferase
MSNIKELATMVEIKVSCPPVLASYLEELLWTVDGAFSVTCYYQHNAQTDQTQLSDLSSVALLTHNPLGEDLVKVLLVNNPRLLKVCTILEAKTLTPKDWEHAWKEHWHPTPVTEKLTLCPSWEAYTPKSPDETVIRLDPENAFGTGAHETTQLALQAMEQYAATQDFSRINVMDVGTGSGVLAIYAAMKGCQSVTGLDNDASAVQTARKNAMRNHVGHLVNFLETPLSELCLTRYNLIVVNIIAPVILALWDDLLPRLEKPGQLVLTGLLERNVENLYQKLEGAGFTAIHQTRQNHWFCLSGERTK